MATYVDDILDVVELLSVFSLPMTDDGMKPPRTGKGRVDMLKDRDPLSVKVIQSPEPVKIRPEDGYSLGSRPRGFALIVNNINFPGIHRRHGAEKDKIYTIQLLTQMGFVCIYKEDVWNEKDMADNITTFQKKFEEIVVDACIVVIMSHGNNGQVSMLDGSSVNVWKKIVYKFNNHDTNVPQRLKEIPKVFIFQSCQSWRTGVDSMKEEEDPQAKITNAIVCFSTMPGEEARRDMYKGSWFIYCLTKVLMENAHEMDLESMLKKVQEKELLGVVSDCGYVQVCFWSTFVFKRLFFNPQALSKLMKQSGIHKGVPTVGCGNAKVHAQPNADIPNVLQTGSSAKSMASQTDVRRKEFGLKLKTIKKLDPEKQEPVELVPSTNHKTSRLTALWQQTVQSEAYPSPFEKNYEGVAKFHSLKKRNSQDRTMEAIMKKKDKRS